MLRSAILASLTCLTIAASPALAARHDDHRATSRFLAAAATYLTAAVAAEVQTNAALDTLTAHVNSACPRTLASNPAQTPTQQDVENTFALAAGAEAGLAAVRAAATPLTAYVHRLARLRWNDPVLNRLAATAVRSRERALALSPPDLCAEVAAAAANGFAAVPPRIAAFVTALAAIGSPPNVRHLLARMKPYLTAGEKPKAARLRRLEAGLDAALKRAIPAASQRLQTALLGG